MNEESLHTLNAIADALVKDVQKLRFGPPVMYVYNPLDYAGEAHRKYVSLYGHRPKEVLLLGMNPGPWGMAQTGVPFGEVNAVRDWLRIEAAIGKPEQIHPKRAVDGFDCSKSEVSGKRLWGWAKKTFQSPEHFFERFFVLNYCPLLFIEASGRNRTPNNLKASDRKPLFEACDRALKNTVELLKPRYVVGVGNFAEKRAQEALDKMPVIIGRITHPSPANPRANRDWDRLVRKEFLAIGIQI